LLYATAVFAWRLAGGREEEGGRGRGGRKLRPI